MKTRTSVKAGDCVTTVTPQLAHPVTGEWIPGTGRITQVCALD